MSPLLVLVLSCHHCRFWCCFIATVGSSVVMSPLLVLVLSCHHCWFWCCFIATVGSGVVMSLPLSVLVLSCHCHCRFWCCHVTTVGFGVAMSPLLVLVLPCRETTTVHTHSCEASFHNAECVLYNNKGVTRRTV